jgi:hypothetical protein
MTSQLVLLKLSSVHKKVYFVRTVLLVIKVKGTCPDKDKDENNMYESCYWKE